MFINVINYNSTSVRRYVLPPFGPLLTCRPGRAPTLRQMIGRDITSEVPISREHAATLLKIKRRYHKEQRNG